MMVMAWTKLLLLALMSAILLLSSIENGVSTAGMPSKNAGNIKTSSKQTEPIAEGDVSDGSYVEYIDGGPLGSLYDFLIANRLQRFCKLLRKANIDDILVEMGIFTIFAPMDGAFAFLPGGTLEELEKNPRLLQEFILYHFVEGDLQTTSITDELVVESLQRIPLRFNIYGPPPDVITVSGAEILEGDLKFDVGRLHIIDRPLYPYPKTDILAYLKLNYNQFYQLILKGGLAEYLSGGTYTIFVPDDQSFDYLSIDLKDALRFNETLAYRIVLSHVLPSTFFVRGFTSGMQTQSVEGFGLTFTQRRGLTFVNGFPIILPDIPVTNGVIHAINRVILPEGVESDCHCKPRDTSRPSGSGFQTPTTGSRGTTRKPIQTNEITPRPGRRPSPGSRTSISPGIVSRPPISPSPGQRSTFAPRPGILSTISPISRPSKRPVLTPRPHTGSRPITESFEDVKTAGKPIGMEGHGDIPQVPGQRPSPRQPPTHPHSPVSGTQQISGCRQPGERPGPGDRRPLCSVLDTPAPVGPVSSLDTPYPGPPIIPQRPGTGAQVTPSPGIRTSLPPSIASGTYDCRTPGERTYVGDRRPLCPPDTIQEVSQPPYPQPPSPQYPEPQRPGTGIKIPQITPKPGKQKPEHQTTPQLNCREAGERANPGDRRPLCRQKVPSDTQCRLPTEHRVPGDRRPVCSPGQIPAFDCRTSDEQVLPGDRRPLCESQITSCRSPGERAIPGDRRPPCPPSDTDSTTCRKLNEPAVPGDTRPLCQQDVVVTPDCRQPGERFISGDIRPLCSSRTRPEGDCRLPGERVSPGDRRPFCPSAQTPELGCRFSDELVRPGDRRPLCPEDVEEPNVGCRSPGEPSVAGDTRPPCSPAQPEIPSCRLPGERAVPGDRRPVCPPEVSITPDCRQRGERVSPGDRRPFCSTEDDSLLDCRRPEEQVIPGDRRPLCTESQTPSLGCRTPGEHSLPGDRRPMCRPQQPSVPNCRLPGEKALPGDRRPVCPPDISSTPDCRQPGELTSARDRRPLCPHEHVSTPDCRLPGERTSPGDRRPLCPPEDVLTPDCRQPAERASPGDRRPLCPPEPVPKPDCRQHGERASPGDRRPVCPHEHVPTPDCRQPAERASPGDRRPLCPPEEVPKPDCRQPAERASPGDRRPLCPPEPVPKPDCRQHGERASPGDRRPHCPPEHVSTSNCRQPAERASPGDRRPLCQPEEVPKPDCRQHGERASPRDRRPVCPHEHVPTFDCRLPAERASPGDRRPICPPEHVPTPNCRQHGERASPGDRRPHCPPEHVSKPDCRQHGERASPGDRRPLCPPEHVPTPDCRQDGERALPGDRRPLCPHEHVHTPDCRQHEEIASPGDRRPLCPHEHVHTPDCRQHGERASPGDRRPVCSHEHVPTSECRLPAERASPGDRRPLCPPEHVSTPDCRQDGERVLPGDRRPLCPHEHVHTPDCRQHGEIASPGDTRPFCPHEHVHTPDCRQHGEIASPGDRRPFCQPEENSSDCRRPDEQIIPGDRRPLCTQSEIPSQGCRGAGERRIPGDRRPLCTPQQVTNIDCRRPGERTTLGDRRPLCSPELPPLSGCRPFSQPPRGGDRRPQCPVSTPGDISPSNPTIGPFTQRPTGPQQPGFVPSSPYPESPSVGNRPSRPTPPHIHRGQTTRQPGQPTSFPSYPPPPSIDDNFVDSFTDTYYPEDYEPSVQRPGQPPRLQPPSQIPGHRPGQPPKPPSQTPGLRPGQPSRGQNQIPTQPPRRQTPSSLPSPGQPPRGQTPRPGTVQRPGQPPRRQTPSQRPFQPIPTPSSRRTTESSRTTGYPLGPDIEPGRPGYRPEIPSSQFTTRAPVFPPRRPGQSSHATKGQPYDPSRHPPQHRRPTERYPPISSSLPGFTSSTGNRGTSWNARNPSLGSSSGSSSSSQTSTRGTFQINRQNMPNCRQKGERVTPQTQSLPLCPSTGNNDESCQPGDQPYDPSDSRPVCENNVDEDFYATCRNPGTPFDPADTRPVCRSTNNQNTLIPSGRHPGQPARNPSIDNMPDAPGTEINQRPGHISQNQPPRSNQFTPGSNNRRPVDSQGQHQHLKPPTTGHHSRRPGTPGRDTSTGSEAGHVASGGVPGHGGQHGSHHSQPHGGDQRHSTQTSQRAPQTSSRTTPSLDGGTTISDDSPRSLYEIVEDPALLIRGHPVQLSKIFELFQKAGLEYILRDSGPQTLFLPSDDAFHRLPKGVIEQLEANPELLRQVLLYHVTASEVLPAGVDESYLVPSVEGNKLLITMLNGGRLILISGAKAVAVTRASNGIFYVINQLLYPLPQDDIVSALNSRPDLSQITTFIGESGLQDILQGDKPYTLFAPTDNAFNQLPESVIQELSQNTTAIRQLLMGHIVEGAHYGREFLTGANYPNLRGGTLNLKVVSFGYQVNDVNIKTPEIVTGTGVIHVIDEILLTPQDTTLIDSHLTKLHNSLEGVLSTDRTGHFSGSSNSAGGTGGTFSSLSAGYQQNTRGGGPGSPTMGHGVTNTRRTSSHESTFTRRGAMVIEYGSTATGPGPSHSGPGFTSTLNETSGDRAFLSGHGFPNSGYVAISSVSSAPASGHGSHVHGSQVSGHGSQVAGHGSQVSGHGSQVSGHGSSSVHGSSGLRQGSSSVHGSSGLRQGSSSDESGSPAMRLGSVSSGYGSDHGSTSSESGSERPGHGLTPTAHGSHHGLGHISSNSEGSAIVFSESAGGHGSSLSTYGQGTGQTMSHSGEHYSGVAQQASDIGLSRFASLLTTTGISDKVQDGGTYTVFAPTNEALRSLQNLNSNQLKIVLLYHIVPQKLGSRSVQNDETASTLLEGKKIRFNLYREGHIMTALGVPIEQPHNGGSVNLVPVDQVLTPPEGNLMKLVESMPNLKEFAKAVKDSRLTWMLSGEGSWTLFAPSDVAFQSLSEEDRKNMVENRQAFTDLLKKHILRGTLFTTGLEDGTQKRTENRKTVTFSVQNGAVAIDSVPLSYSDVPATNGVLHIIDSFL